MEDDLINGVLLFILFRDEGVVVAHSDFVLLGAVSISAHRNGGMREHRLLEREEKRFCVQSVFTGGTQTVSGKRMSFVLATCIV